MSRIIRRHNPGRHSAGYWTGAGSRVRPVDVSRYTLLVRLISILFLAILVEGIARKWLFPSQHQYFYFLRDPLVLTFYLIALRRGALRATGWCALWLGAAYFISVLSLLVYLVKNNDPLVWMLGLRSYFLYIPLAFIVAQTFDREDIGRFAQLMAVLAVPVAFVCVLQFDSSPGTQINLGAGGSKPPLLAGDVMRTTGLLASDAQHVSYMAFTLSVLAAVLVSGKSLREKGTLLFLGVAATLTMMVVSGSRGVWFQGAGIFVGALAAFFLTRARGSRRLRAAMVPLAAGILVAVLFTTVFTKAYDAFESRNRAARTFSNVTTERIVGMFLPRWMFESSIEGIGIGIATTGAAAFETGERALTHAESDWDRNFVELGLINGGVFVALRIAFSAWLVWLGFRAARMGDPTTFVLACFAGPAILTTQITMHTVYAHFAWFAAGLTMAAARCALMPRGREWSEP